MALEIIPSKAAILAAGRGERLRLGPHIDLPISKLAHAYEEGLPRAPED